MNREIKFRAWDKQYKSMSNVNMILFSANEIDIDGNLGEPKSLDHYELMQYTGLQDKNGKEIYEGDILLCHEYDSSDIGGKIIQTFKNAVVGFENGSFYYYPKGNMKQHHQLLMYAYMPEIIGNIYQNPELLNKQ